MLNLTRFFKRAYAPAPTTQEIAKLQLTQAKVDYLALRHNEEDHLASAACCAAQADEINSRIDRLTAYIEHAQ